MTDSEKTTLLSHEYLSWQAHPLTRALAKSLENDELAALRAAAARAATLSAPELAQHNCLIRARTIRNLIDTYVRAKQFPFTDAATGTTNIEDLSWV